jgi:uncharacterized 2Fe-2S/4Fe-4S cluster protein (DUF4445 family)
MLNLDKREAILESHFPNPQSTFGLDVITRMDYSLRDMKNQWRIQMMIRSAISDQIEMLCSTKGFDSSDVTSVVIVGNTVMHHLFFGLPLHSLTKPPYAAEDKDAINTLGSKVGLTSVPEAKCYSPPVVESFIGPDALMLILVSGLLDSDSPSIAVDVGTNTEIAVRNSDELWIASAASGPAFEGMVLDCGMPAENGAIARVGIDHEYRPTTRTIGGGRARGICGSGAISALAALLDVGLMNQRGSLTRTEKPPWLLEINNSMSYILTQAMESETRKPIYLSQADLRMLQLSKASLHAATTLLLNRIVSNADDITRVFLTGAFGSGLDMNAAFRIGLFPRFTSASIEQFLGGAAKGASILTYDLDLRNDLEDTVKRLKYVELTMDEEFPDLFLESQFYSDT